MRRRYLRRSTRSRCAYDRYKLSARRRTRTSGTWTAQPRPSDVIRQRRGSARCDRPGHVLAPASVMLLHDHALIPRLLLPGAHNVNAPSHASACNGRSRTSYGHSRQVKRPDRAVRYRGISIATAVEEKAAAARIFVLSLALGAVKQASAGPPSEQAKLGALPAF